MVIYFDCIMKKIFILIFIALLSFQMQGQDIKTPNNPIPGKVYATCIKNTSDIQYKEKYVLKVVFPQWEKSTDTIFKNPDKKWYITRPPTMRWHFAPVDENCLSSQPSDCVLLAYIEVPAQSQIIHFAENDSFKIIQIERLIRPASLEWVLQSSILKKEDFKKLSPYESGKYKYFRDEKNQIVYVYSDSNNWGEWKDVICGSGCYAPSYLAIHKSLKQKGYYSDTLSNILNESTKLALVQFQKDNNLPVGNLDFDTLRMLGVLPDKPQPSPHLLLESNKTLRSLNKW